MLTHLRTLRARLTRSWKAVALVAVGALAGSTVLAVASVPDSNGMIHLCYVVTAPTNGEAPVPITTAPNVTLLDPSAGQSCSDIKTPSTYKEQALTINQTGIQGTQGATGAPGAPGLAGTPGIQGASGIQGVPGLLLPVKSSSIGQVTLEQAAQGKVGNAPVEISFTPISVTLGDKRRKGSLTIVKQLDTTSSSLLQAMSDDREFKTGKIVVDGTNGKSLTQYELTNAVITSSKIDGTENDKTQSLTLKYETIVVKGA
jgi:type VI protein secretion system component Hcp